MTGRAAGLTIVWAVQGPGPAQAAMGASLNMLTQAQAQALIEALKEAIRRKRFEWTSGIRHDEVFVAVEDDNLRFILSLNRSPFKIRLHLRTTRGNIGLLRVDGARYHQNPDGTELRDTPHLHVYREDHDLRWAHPIDWYHPDDPIKTLNRFLDEAHASFPGGIQHTFT